MIRYSVINGTQTIKEICEHCNEEIRDLHISEVTVKNPNDPRTIKIVGPDGRTKQDVPLKADFIADKTGSYIREGLLDNGSEALKYGVRPEAMCSQSIDAETGVTSSYCYRTAHPKFLTKFSSSYHTGSEIATTDSGSKVGVDRKGNVIRIKSERPLGTRSSGTKRHHPWNVSWFRALSSANQKLTWDRHRSCNSLSSNTLDTYRDYATWQAAYTRYCR